MPTTLDIRRLARGAAGTYSEEFGGEIPDNPTAPESYSDTLAYTSPLASQDYEDLTITAVGTNPGDLVTVSPDGDPGAGCLWVAWVSATDTITVRLVNPTAGPATLTTRTWYAVTARGL